MTGIILIDDDSDILGLYRRMLKDSEFEILGTANDGVAGLVLANQTQPQLVVLDLSMPNADGLEVLVAMRRDQPQTPIVVVSGFNRDVLWPIAKKLGAVGYVQKGASPADLLAALRQAAQTAVPRFMPVSPNELDAMRQRLSELI